MTDTNDYATDARGEAADLADNFLDEIVEQLLREGAASADLFNDYPGGDEEHHNITDNMACRLNLSRAAELLDRLADYEETEYSLWQGLDPRRAIKVQAAYTYGNAVSHYWRELIASINDDGEVRELLTAMEQDREDDSEQEQGEAEERLRSLVQEIISGF